MKRLIRRSAFVTVLHVGAEDDGIRMKVAVMASAEE